MQKHKLFSCLGSLVIAGGMLTQASGETRLETAPSGSMLTAIANDSLDEIFFGPPTAAEVKAEKKAETKAETQEIDLDELFGTSPDTATESEATVPVSNKLPTDGEEASELPSEKSATDPGTKDAPGSVQSDAPAKTEIAPPQETLSPELQKLREKVRDCLGHYYNQVENVVDHSPWGVMHILIAYGVDTEVLYAGSKTNAIGYLCYNGNCRGLQLFYLDRGRLEARIGPGVQGHEGQFLAMLAQSKVKIDYPMLVENKAMTVADLVEYEKRTCMPATELTFKLIGLSHYLDTDTKWKSQTGEEWSVARLIREELAQPIIGAACGGTHRLMGFNYAVRKREKEGKPMTGQYLRARKFLDDYFEYTFYLQNDDGSFSTDFFRGPNSYGDVNLRLETTGHILEWFVASLSDEQLRDPRVVKGMDYLATLMLQHRRNNWEIGPKGHALHALAIYGERVFGDKPGTRDAVLARGKKLQVAAPKQR